MPEVEVEIEDETNELTGNELNELIGVGNELEVTDDMQDEVLNGVENVENEMNNDEIEVEKDEVGVEDMQEMS